MKNRPLLIIAFTAVLLIWVLWQSLGGIEGIRREPGLSFSVIGIVVATALPFLWFRYRRLKRKPIYEEVRDPGPTAQSGGQLDKTPLVFAASRIKAITLLAFSVLTFSVGAMWLWAQPGVCRVIGIATTAPFMAFALMMAVVGAIVKERLEITPQGLTHSTFWRSRSWSWDEIRNITLLKLRGFGFAWTSGIVFNRFSSDRYATGPARVMLRPIWPIASDKLAELLNVARLRWSSSKGASFVAVNKGVSHYLPIAITWLIVGIVLYLIIGRPCG